MAADASNHGVGAVISHTFTDGTEKAVMHAAKSLTPAERNYSQVEKEALALIFAVKKIPQDPIRASLYTPDGPQTTSFNIRLKERYSGIFSQSIATMGNHSTGI